LSERTIFICRASTPEGIKDYVTLMPPELTFKVGLIPEAIVGVLTRPLDPDEPITPEVFARNRVFVDFMHEVLGREAPKQAACQAEAQRIGNGWVYLIDQRTPTPEGHVPPHDIIGAIEVKDGRIVNGSYSRSERHVVLSPDGFFRLSPDLHECLIREIRHRSTPKFTRSEPC
jgi:hypothetical protein